MWRKLIEPASEITERPNITASLLQSVDHMGFCSGFSPLIKVLPFLSSNILYEEKVLMRSSAVKRGGMESKQKENSWQSVIKRLRASDNLEPFTGIFAISLQLFFTQLLVYTIL